MGAQKFTNGVIALDKCVCILLPSKRGQPSSKKHDTKFLKLSVPVFYAGRLCAILQIMQLTRIIGKPSG